MWRFAKRERKTKENSHSQSKLFVRQSIQEFANYILSANYGKNTFNVLSKTANRRNVLYVPLLCTAGCKI